VSNTPTYARIVADMARYRRLLAAADELAAAVARFDDTAIDQAVKAITEAA
jgi:replicative DNA helicase